jgi:hypothetical protein
MPMSLRRNVDNAVFDTGGYQHAEFFFSFDNIDFDSAYIQIIADEYDQVEELDASLLIDTFSTDVPYSDILKGDKNKIYLRIFKPELSQIKPGVEYKLSVDLRIEPQDSKALPVLYKPFFSIGVEDSHSISELYYGNEVEMPMRLLPEHVSRASVSTNVVNSWVLSLFRQKTAALNEIIEKQYQ